MRTSILLFAFLLSGAAAFAQGPIPPSGQVQAGKARASSRKPFLLRFISNQS